MLAASLTNRLRRCRDELCVGVQLQFARHVFERGVLSCIRDCTWCVVSCIDFRSLGLGLALFAVDVDGWTLSVMKCRKGIRDASLAM